MNTQQYHSLNYATRFESASWLSGLAACSLLALLPFQTNNQLKTFLALNTLGVCIVGRVCSKGGVMAGARADDERDVTDQMYVQQLATEMYTDFDREPKQREKPAIKPRNVFKIERLISEKASFPHVLIVGQTGSGKTLLAEYLVDKDRRDTLNTFVAPCRDDNEFSDYATVGLGFNYDAIRKYTEGLLRELTERYNTPLQEVIPQFSFRNVIFDEGTDTLKEIESLSQMLLRLIGMARKRFIRVWLCTTAQNVKALNIEGEGESRKNFTYIRLGKDALAYLQQLVREGVYSDEDEKWFLSQIDLNENGEYRLAMVDEYLCILPDLSSYRAGKLERGGTAPTETLDNLLLSLADNTPQPAKQEELSIDYTSVSRALTEGMTRTAIGQKLNLKGDKRKKFWEGYEQWLQER